MKPYKIDGCGAYQRIAVAQGNERITDENDKPTFLYYHLEKCNTCSAIADKE